MDNTIAGNIKLMAMSLTKSYREYGDIIKADSDIFLNRSHIIEDLGRLQILVFPGFFGKKHVSRETLEYYAGNILEEVQYSLSEQAARALEHAGVKCGAGTLAEERTFQFLSALPEVRAYLAQDVQAAFDGDPAASGLDEIITSYPGIYAIMAYRLAHVLYTLGVPLIPRIMTEHAHSVTGIDIHPGASIGHYFFIDHGTGIVIGETTVIGDHVKIYQGVTLGGHSTRGGQSLRGTKRHPTIEDRVTIYSGASIFGGTTVIGEGAVIGSSTFITKSVAPHSRVIVKNEERLQTDADSGAVAPDAAAENGDTGWDWVI
ncbi:MAG: serine acetyltransferase [Spirochaetaceae bacterium]|jgi:serine O-acetyltransferase|nr:serine acetyltransferase [Spirochaetaceae bacterium]